MEHFKEYFLYQPFLVKTNNNPLTYIMTTPNINATGHQWVGALARFNFQLEYWKGCDNTVVDVLIQITTHLNPYMVRLVLDGTTLGAAQRAECQDPAVVEGDHDVEKEVHVTAGWVLVQIHMIVIPVELHKCIGPVRPSRGKQGEFPHYVIYGGNSGLIGVDPHHSRPIHPLSCSTLFGQYK